MPLEAAVLEVDALEERDINELDKKHASGFQEQLIAREHPQRPLRVCGHTNSLLLFGNDLDAFHAAALAAGATDHGELGLRHYHPHYYGAFVLDPDGYNVEAVCHTPAG